MNWIIVKEESKVIIIPEQEVFIIVHNVKNETPEFLVRTSNLSIKSKTAPVLVESYEKAVVEAAKLCS